jgi:hypothetical protein
MPDVVIGYTLIGIGILVVLAVVFVISSRVGTAQRRQTPPRGVHVPAPSSLPVVLSVAAALIGAGLAFRAEDQIVNPFLAIPGLGVLVIGMIAWVRAANHEWRDAEHGSHHDSTTH